MTETIAQSVCESSTRMEHVLLLNKGFSIQKNLKTCCKPHYKMRRVKNKGAITVLVLSYLVTSALVLLVSFVANNDDLSNQAWLPMLMFGITTSLAGWLADAIIGRYKVICCSVWTVSYTHLTLPTIYSV